MAWRTLKIAPNDDLEINPYAAPGVTELEVVVPASPDVQVTFSGQVTEAHLARTFSIAIWPTAIALCFYLIAFAGCSALLNLLYGLWVAVAVFAFGMITAVVLLVLAGIVMKPRVQRLIRDRPWLLGKVHGTFSTAFTTIWHKDVGIQMVSHDLTRHVNRNGYVLMAHRKPYAIVPSVCFYEADWHRVLDSLELKQLGFLHLPLPPDGAHACTLLIDRLPFLDTRLHGYRGRWSQGLGSWLVATIVTGGLGQLLSDIAPVWFYFAMIPVLVLAFYLFRTAFWRWHTRRQFANERRGYLSLPTEETKRSVDWFTDDTVFWCDGLIWIQMPIRFISRMRVEFSVIEFFARGMEFRFHREGFSNHKAWLAATDSAKRIQAKLLAG